MKIKIIDCGSSKVPFIEEMVRSLGASTEIQKMSEYHFSNENAIIISGAPILLTETNYEDHLIQVKKILDTEVPVLGICFGHQIIGLHFGAEIKKCEADRDDQKIIFSSESRLSEELKGEFIFNEDHCECISLPSGFKLIASSRICEVEMMEHTDKNIYGVQFHPETSGDNGKRFFQFFIEKCKL